MKKLILIALLGVACCAESVFAADIPARLPVKAPPLHVASYDWSGFYTASSIGGGWQHLDGVFTPVPPPDTFNTHGSHAWLGTHVGIQKQWGAWVLGVEGAYDAPWDRQYDVSIIGPDCLNISGGPPVPTCHGRIHDILMGGGKLGYAFDRVMIYGAGGYANGRIDTVFTNPTGAVGSTSSERHDGWYAGAGVDFFVTRIWWSDLILGVEYRHIELSTKHHPDDFGQLLFDKDMSGTADLVMAKATFKWIGVGPFSALK